MAAYSDHLGALVTVRYRLGDILLSATGVFVGDSGRSIFLEQHLEQRGRRNYFRWEIPYANIHSIEVKSEAEEEADGSAEEPRLARSSAAAGGAVCECATTQVILPLSQPSKTA